MVTTLLSLYIGTLLTWFGLIAMKRSHTFFEYERKLLYPATSARSWQWNDFFRLRTRATGLFLILFGPMILLSAFLAPLGVVDTPIETVTRGGGMVGIIVWASTGTLSVAGGLVALVKPRTYFSFERSLYSPFGAKRWEWNEFHRERIRIVGLAGMVFAPIPLLMLLEVLF